MKTYWKEDKFITEEGNKRIIKDYTYHFFPDFFKPLWIEFPLYLYAGSASILAGHEVYTTSKGNIFITTAYALLPQILAYGFCRLMELIALTDKKANKELLDLKHQPPHKPKTTTETIDKIVEDNNN
jgi:hypothetical protein